MTDNNSSKGISEKPIIMPWSVFLCEHPPGGIENVSKAVTSIGVIFDIQMPEIQLHCPESTCNMNMFFSSVSYQPTVKIDEWKFFYLTYRCKNCNNYTKTFSLAIKVLRDELCQAFKFGELPSFGPPLPSRVLRLIEPDRDLFLSGRRSENQGLGIGAFSYYRRVVENQWTRLVNEIIGVSKKINAFQEIIECLEKSKDERQFSKAIKDVKETIPPILLVNGHNPLILLHSVLSKGVHDLSDEECLELATSIRLILVELSEKLGQALKDEKELNNAITRLIQIRSNSKGADKPTGNVP